VSAVFAAFLEKHLVANTNTQKRSAAQSNLFYQFSKSAQGANGITESGNSGQNDTVGIFNGLWFTAKLYIAADIPKRVTYAFDISYIVVDNNYHNLPLTIYYRDKIMIGHEGTK
jgi:hypothetical protein